LTPLSTVILG